MASTTSTPPPDTDHASLQRAIDDLIAAVGPVIKLGIPLGLGKPTQFVNALYRRVKNDATLSLEIFTALSLEVPAPHAGLERALMQPFLDRVFGGYVGLDYMTDIRKGMVPANIRVHEFFLKSGSYIGNDYVQQNYISTNYTHAPRDLVAHGVNVVAQMVALDPARPGVVSLSCNPEVTLDILAQSAVKPFLVAQVHRGLPFMSNEAVVACELFDAIIDEPVYETTLFAPPNMPVTGTDYLIGLYASSLVKDEGTLQIGIGSLGDAVAYCLEMRHERNESYRNLLQSLNAYQRFGDSIDTLGGDGRFNDGLYGCSEMFINGFLYLLQTGILKREVYPNERLQQLIDDGVMQKEIGADIFSVLIAHRVIHAKLARQDVDLLKQIGVLTDHAHWRDDALWIIHEQFVNPDLDDTRTHDFIMQHALGNQLRGSVMHGGFFLGPHKFYDDLRKLDGMVRDRITMTNISYVNHLYGQESLKRAQRKNARFINTAFTLHLLGAATSDAVDSGRIVSGVGGQYNFVAQAHELKGARSILMCKSTREKSGQVSSNIVPHYGHVTIPRHLRDIFVTEYGIADVRGKCDADVCAAMIAICDSRFQQQLVTAAISAGKLPRNYQIPAQHRNNFPDHVQSIIKKLQAQGELPAFPFGSDFTAQELKLAKALKQLAAQKQKPMQLVSTLLKGLTTNAAQHGDDLQRLGLNSPKGLQQKLERLLVLGTLP